MNRKNGQGDSNTDFFLKFISKQENQKQPKIDNKKNQEIKVPDLIQKTLSTVSKVFNSINTILDKIILNKQMLKIFSFFLALGLVLSMNGGNFSKLLESQNAGQYFENVPVKVIGLQNDYDETGIPKTVSVSVIGSSLSLNSLKLSGNYYAYADLSGFGPGNHMIELKTENFPKDLKVTVVPQTVSVSISTKVTKAFDLGYKFINTKNLAKDLSVSINSMSIDKVDVSGSQDNISRIVEVKANIDLEGISKSFEQSSKIYAYDRSGEKVDVEINPSTVNVDCIVSNYSKTVPIKVNYTGAIASGYGVKSINLSQEEVTIYGAKSKLKSIDSVDVDIDLTDLSDDVTLKSLKLHADNSVYKMSESTIDANIDIEPAISKTITGIKIGVKNNDAGYTVLFLNSDNNVSVQVSGIPEIINQIKPEDIKAYIDIKGLTPGRRTVEVKATGKNTALQYSVVTNNKIEIRIRK